MRLFLAVMYAFGVVSMSASICWPFMRANRNKQTYFFMICQLLIIIWSISQLILLESVTETQIFASYCSGNFAICFIGSIWYIFSKIYLDGKISVKKLVVLIGISVCNYMIIITNNFHHMYYSEFTVEKIERGTLFYENILYTYLCLSAGIINILKKLKNEKNKRTGQTVLIICAVLLPFAANILYLSGFMNTDFDVTPLTFGFSSIMVLLAIYKYGFLNVNSMAYEKIFESIAEGVFIFNAKGRITYSNNGAENLMSNVENIKDIEVYKEICDYKSQYCEVSVIKDKKNIRIKRYNYFAGDGDIMASVFIISDITRYYELIERTAQLAAANESLAIEKERNRIAQEVHDTAGHTLTMLNSLVKLSQIELAEDKKDNVADYLEKAEKIASQGIAQLRISINNLKQGKYCNNIVSGIEELISEIKEIDTELCVQGEENENHSYYSSVIYQCCREAITNCLRYSQADRIDIIIKFHINMLELYVIDNGKGCDSISYGNGLNGISARVENAGGKAVFSSSAGNGFSMTIKIPTGEKS